MVERLTTPQEALRHRLGAALTMERTVLEMLEDDARHAQDDEVAQLFRHHQEETREQIETLEQAFATLGWEVGESPCPAIEGIRSGGEANAERSDDAIVDCALLLGAAEAEHHEIAVYEGLIISTRALGREDVVRLLQRNLEQEEHTLSEVKEALHRVAAVSIGQPA